MEGILSPSNHYYEYKNCAMKFKAVLSQRCNILKWETIQKSKSQLEIIVLPFHKRQVYMWLTDISKENSMFKVTSH